MNKIKKLGTQWASNLRPPAFVGSVVTLENVGVTIGRPLWSSNSTLAANATNGRFKFHLGQNLLKHFNLLEWNVNNCSVILKNNYIINTFNIIKTI